VKREYWDDMAEEYEDEIFSVLENDRQGLILDILNRYGNEDQTAGDLGCGIGHFLPALAERFREVYAVDFSSRCIARAKKKNPYLDNVVYRTVDLSSSRNKLPVFDLVLSVNAVITQSITHRKRILDSICRHVRRGGYLILVLPSLESAMLACFRLIEWNLTSGIRHTHAAKAGFETNRNFYNKRLNEGLVPIDGVDTKHFLQEELTLQLENRGMEVVNTEKIRYTWKTEFNDPPRWMKRPYPWDWLVTTQKIK
jgi:2-polyprenyl-3-methyl-5-hydroxy-6-metoxy-1,4-benzoquinol methylase